ncbi:MAG: cytidine deaminase, partial [Pseudomonadota bacterium]
PQGTCAEAGAIAAMVAAGEREIAEVAVIAGGAQPVAPCGGCRQKLLEFAGADVRVTMATTAGGRAEMTMAELLPGAFTAAQME